MKVFRLALGALLSGIAPASVAREQSRVATQNGVWLRGDLHVHSRHSEDSSNHTIAAILKFAGQAGMDFLLVSDHDNHVAGAIAQNTWADPEFRSDKILLLYGAEWTTHRGHANPISARRYNHQLFYNARDDRDIRIAAVKKKLGIHLSANHPANNDAFSFSYDMVDSIEVWNSVLSSRNKGALAIWDDLLKSGRMIAGRGGSDAHHGQVSNLEMTNERAREASANNIGTPTTWVWAGARTNDAVVKALTEGRASISANPFAARVEFSADFDRDGRADMQVGDNTRWTGGAIDFQIALVGGADDVPFYTANIVKNGEPFQSLKIDKTRRLLFTDTPERVGRTYYRVEIRGVVPPYPQVPNASLVAGDLVAISNPIYFNFDPDF